MLKKNQLGEIFASRRSWYGTSGTSISGGMSENNYLGKGKQLGTNLSLSDDS